MGKKKLYSTTDEAGEEYRTKHYKESIENPSITHNPYVFSSTINEDPRKGISYAGGHGNLVRPEETYSSFDEGFQGSSMEELDKYRIDNQWALRKAFNTVLGGFVSGAGSIIENMGYIGDMETYGGIFGAIDYDANKELGLYDININQLVAKGLQKLGAGIKETAKEYTPVYERQGTSIADQVFSWESLRGVLDSAVGFAGSGYGAGMLVKGLSKGIVAELANAGRWTEAALASKQLKYIPSVISKIESGANKLGRLEAYTRLLQKTQPIYNEVFGSLAAGVVNKGAEARIEGLGSYEESMTMMQPLIDKGLMTYEDANKKANEVATNAFRMTMLTAAGDAYMIKGLFTGAKVAENAILAPGFRKTLTKAGKHLVGAPKEGLEEMWQESAAMESQYDTYNYVKDKLKKDPDLNALTIKQIGFNPEDMPKGFLERTVSMLSSNRSQIAGWIGAISGPLQALGMHALDPNRSDRAKAEKEQYEEQQTIFKNNEGLFNATKGFIEKTKSVTLIESMREVAALADDPVMQDITDEVALQNVATENFTKGTTDNLKKVLDAEGTTQATKLKSKLQSMETDYKKSKQFLNAEDVFTAKRNIKIYRQLIDHYESKTNDEELSIKEREAYENQTKVAVVELLKEEQRYKELTSTSNQYKLLEERTNNEEKFNIYNSLNKNTSISSLESFKTKYADDPEFVKAMDEKIESIKKVNEGKVTQTITKPNITKSEEITEEEKTNKEDELIIGQEYSFNASPVKVTDVIKDSNGKITSVLVEGRKTPIQNYSKTNKEFLNKFKGVKNEIVEETTQGIPVLKGKELTEQITDLTTKEFDRLNQDKKLKVSAKKSHIQEVTKVYREAVRQNKTQEELTSLLQKKIVDLHEQATGVVRDRSNDLSELKPQVETVVEGFLDMLDKNVVDTILEQGIKKDESKGVAPLSPMRKTQALIDALITMIEVIEDNGTRVQGNFKALIDTILKVKNGTQRVSTHYELLREIFLLANFGQISRESIPETFNEFLGITVEDYTDYDDMPTEEQVKAILAVTNNQIAPHSDLVSILGIYTNDNVMSDDNKNTSPATSFAYRSQQWEFDVQTYNENQLKIGRKTIDKTVDGNPILNANKFNPGQAIYFEPNLEYKGENKLSNGDIVKWEEIEKAGKTSASWEEFQKKHKLGADEIWTDYYPITINTVEDKKVAYIHDVSWINNVTTIDDQTIKLNKKALRQFKKDLVEAFKKNGNQPIESVVTDRVIEITKEGAPSGFVLNTSNRKLTADALPEQGLKFGNLTLTGVEVNNNDIINNNILNKSFLNFYPVQTMFVLTPLGKTDGKMKYWAHAVMPNKISFNIANTLQQAIEIFITQNPEVNKELYDAMIKGEDNINLLNAKDLSKLLNKVIYLYNSKKRKGESVEDFVNKHMDKQISVIEFQGDKIKLGRSGIIVLEKTKKGQPSPITDDVRRNIGLILKGMMFNVNKSQLNQRGLFNLTTVNDKNEIEDFTGNYNEFIKQHTTTTANSTLLNDSTEDKPSYGYTIQHIVRFNMNNVIPKEVEKVASKSIPLMMTNKMRQDLSNLGYTKEQISNMTPIQANEILSKKEPVEETSDIQSKIDDTERRRQKDLLNISRGLENRQDQLQVSIEANDASVGNYAKYGNTITKIELTKEEQKEVKRQFKLYNDEDLSTSEFNEWRSDFSTRVLTRVKNEITTETEIQPSTEAIIKELKKNETVLKFVKVSKKPLEVLFKNVIEGKNPLESVLKILNTKYNIVDKNSDIKKNCI